MQGLVIVGGDRHGDRADGARMRDCGDDLAPTRREGDGAHIARASGQDVGIGSRTLRHRYLGPRGLQCLGRIGIEGLHRRPDRVGLIPDVVIGRVPGGHHADALCERHPHVAVEATA